MKKGLKFILCVAVLGMVAVMGSVVQTLPDYCDYSVVKGDGSATPFLVAVAAPEVQSRIPPNTIRIYKNTKPKTDEESH
jgi:hypothetical protein